jgi:hypothetical protein
MRKTYRRPSIVSEQSFESSALSCAKTGAGDALHLGAGSTYISGHYAGSTSYSHTPGTSGPWLHINPGFSSYSNPGLCDLALMTS